VHRLLPGGLHCSQAQPAHRQHGWVVQVACPAHSPHTKQNAREEIKPHSAKKSARAGRGAMGSTTSPTTPPRCPCRPKTHPACTSGACKPGMSKAIGPHHALALWASSKHWGGQGLGCCHRRWRLGGGTTATPGLAVGQHLPTHSHTCPTHALSTQSHTILTTARLRERERERD